MINIIAQSDTDLKTIIFHLLCSHLLKLQARNSTVIATVYTILIFRSPKSLLSGSLELEHETSMDTERIVAGESILSI